MAIVSQRLHGRDADVAAIAGVPATRRPDGADRILAVFTAAGDPRESAARAEAGRRGAPVAVLSAETIDLPALSRRGRPLGYRLSGWTPPPREAASHDAPPPDATSPADAPLRSSPAALRGAVAALVENAGPGEIRVPAGFDPGDPALIWLDPYDRRRIPAWRALEIAADVLRHRGRTARRTFAVGLTSWKRPIATSFLDGPNGAPVFLNDPAAAARQARASSGRVVAWASRRIDAAEAAARAEGVPFGRMEDGFVRSIGLGAAFVRPLSLVLDESGVYYDPSRPSDLETILREAEIAPETVERAAALRRRLVAGSFTKYNVGDRAGRVVPPERFGVLVPGQVEDDASILKGAGAVRTNRDLLAAARERRPDAFIVYKPHPDVVAGYRIGAVAEAELARLADAVVVGGSITALYDECAAVETMTSLSGFEALLRGLAVTTHGQPFYAGWGLTEDLAPHPRRGRRRALDELAAAALILYPLYCDPVSGLPCGPETALDRLAEQRARADAPSGRRAARLRHLYALARHRLLGPIARRLP